MRLEICHTTHDAHGINIHAMGFLFIKDASSCYGPIFPPQNSSSPMFQELTDKSHYNLKTCL